MKRDMLREILAGGHWMTRDEIVPLYSNIHVKNVHQAHHLLSVAEAEGVICSGPVEGRNITYKLLDDCVPHNETELSYEESLREMAKRYSRKIAFKQYNRLFISNGLYRKWKNVPKIEPKNTIRDMKRPCKAIQFTQR